MVSSESNFADNATILAYLVRYKGFDLNKFADSLRKNSKKSEQQDINLLVNLVELTVGREFGKRH